MCWCGLAGGRKVFGENEVRKGEVSMLLQSLREKVDSIEWPTEPEDLPVVDWETFQSESRKPGRNLLLVSGFIHDVGKWADEHPGGAGLIRMNNGRDASGAFHGGVYEHSNAAHNVSLSFLSLSRFCYPLRVFCSPRSKMLIPLCPSPASS